MSMGSGSLVRSVVSAGLVLLLTCSMLLAASLSPYGTGEAHAAIQATYYVSPTGSGSTCSLGSPCSITGARDKVRTVNGSMTGDIIVYIMQGDYYVDNTIAFNEADSGTNGYKVIYKNYDATGSARFIGGQAVTGWTQHAGNIYSSYVGTSWEFHELFENGRRAVKARTPNVNSEYGLTTTSQGPWLEYEEISPAPTPGPNKTVFQYQAGDLNPAGWTTADMQVNIYSGGYFNWYNNVVPIAGVDTVNRRITLSQDTVYSLNADEGYGGGRYFVQGDLSLLDAPGEFFLDRTAGYLYYYPRSTPIANQTIIAPKVKDIFRFEGSSETSLVRNIQLEGLTLEVSDFVDRDPAPKLLYTQENAMIYMRNTEYIAVKFSHLKNAGLSAILMRYYNKNNTIYGNWIEQAGISGVSAVGYAGAEAGRSNANRDHVIDNNKIEFVGLHHTEAAGVYTSYSGHNKIVHNELSHSARYHFGSGSDWDLAEADNYFENNYFGYNDLYAGAEDTADTGAVYFGGRVYWAEGNTIEQTRIEKVQWDANAGLSGINQSGVYGVYFDAQNDYWTARNVIVKDVMVDPYLPHISYYHTLSNVSWAGGFDESLMDYKNIGLKADFPAVYGNGGYVWANNDNGAINYSGTWLAGAYSGDYNDDEIYSNIPGDYAEYKFNGTEVKWVSATSWDSGKADVYIDGVWDATVDQYTNTTVRQNAVYHKMGLKDGQHTIRIVVRNDKNANSSGYWTVIDGIGAAATYVDDHLFAYSGTWTGGSYAGDYGGVERYSNNAGDYAQYTFTGTEVRWLSATSWDSGKADVYIDGVLDATVDQYTPTTVRQHVVYEKRGLTPGPHTIRIQARNDKNPSATGYYTVIDGLVYKPLAPAVYVNDTALTTSGTWTADSYAGDFDGNEKYSNIANDYVQITFTGTEVQWISAVYADSGKADVYIDGVLDATVDQYSPGTARQRVVYSKTGLTYGAHTIKIQVRSDKNPASAGYYTVVDAIRYK